MLYGFDTPFRDAAAAAVIVYAIWRSRDRARFKITPDVWGQVERFTKASAKRSRTIPQFIEALKPRLMCATIHPSAMKVGLRGTIPMVETDHGEFLHVAGDDDQREFLTRLINESDERAVIDRLYRETAYVILLVRDRLEREKPIERRFETELDRIGVPA
jgi:hypothetical protein